MEININEVEDGSMMNSSKSGNHAAAARPSANYHPTSWGDFFLKYASLQKGTDEEYGEIERIKQEVGLKLKETLPNDSCLKLQFIDTIQRLGVSYLFEQEIEAVLLRIYNFCVDSWKWNDLHTTSLCFRLMRQHGFHVHDDVFNKFMNEEGKFEASLVNDVRGMLSLYEAANCRVHGDNLLEEALVFTTDNLECMARSSTGFIANQINLAIQMPIRKSLNRVLEIRYISLYEQNESHDEVLLKLAKLDFNRQQRLHQLELGALTKWWKGLDCSRKFPYARDRLVESYFWILGVYFEPQYSMARKMMTKVFFLLTIMNDIYDAYATFDELVLLTDAIERWNMSAINQLPPSLTYFYQALLDVYSTIEEELAKEGRSGQVQYAIGEMKKLARAYHQEAFWCHTNYVPTIEEYMRIGVMSIGYFCLATVSYMGMGDIVTTKVLDWAATEPLIIRAASIILRLQDDISGHEFEQERMHVATSVECYMIQHGGSKQEAIMELQKQINYAFMDLNQECLQPTAVPMVFLERVVNLARVTFTYYEDDDDNFTHSKTISNHLITSMFVDPVII